MKLTTINADCRDGLKQLAAGDVQCCVTSPPYWGLRSYLRKDHPRKTLEIGQEKTPQAYVANLVAVCAEVWRVLKDDGTLWLNLGDSYATGAGSARSPGGKCFGKQNPVIDEGSFPTSQPNRMPLPGLKPKDLIGIPWRVALALQAAGWYLRSDIIWAKPNPMPESVTDRPTRSHEYLFLLTKSPRYYYDAAAIKEPPSPALVKQVQEGYNGKALKDYLGMSVQDASATKSRIIDGYRKRIDKQRGHERHNGFNDKWDALTPAEQALLGSNKRDVWTVAPANYKEAHFATFPPELIKPCIMAGSRPGDTILDPFGGSGTTAQVALELGRRAIICELNDEYLPLIRRRTTVTPGLAL
jgi:DNA modification methylase